MSALPTLIYKFSAIFIQIPTQISVEQEKVNLNSYKNAEVKGNTKILQNKVGEQVLTAPNSYYKGGMVRGRFTTEPTLSTFRTPGAVLTLCVHGYLSLSNA